MIFALQTLRVYRVSSVYTIGYVGFVPVYTIAPGLAANDFKEIYNNHKCDFRIPAKFDKTMLST